MLLTEIVFVLNLQYLIRFRIKVLEAFGVLELLVDIFRVVIIRQLIFITALGNLFLSQKSTRRDLPVSCNHDVVATKSVANHCAVLLIKDVLGLHSRTENFVESVSLFPGSV